MADGVLIDPDRYTGYLAPYVEEIITLHLDGKSPKEISDIIGVVFQATKKHWMYDHKVTPTNIVYALRRIGFPIGKLKEFYPTPSVNRQRLIDEKDEYIPSHLLKWKAPPINKGRPLDMGGPRDVWIEDELWNLKL